MVSQRQRLARRRYRDAHPQLFPKAEHTPQGADKTKDKKKRNSQFKRNKSSGPGTKPIKKGLRKHPLRVPGMKPGDSCFICKAKDHIAKLCPQKAEWDKNKICLLCRQRGHSLKRCPKSKETIDNKLCYNCGESGHSLDKCAHPMQDGGTKFACCFICNGHGHLSKSCPQNTRGIYPKGGCCKICSGVTHLAKDCPDKGKKDSFSAVKEVIGEEGRPRGKVTKFVSGDELDDDFMTENTYSGKIDKSSHSQVGTDGDGLKDSHGRSKSKKKQGPKVVHFTG